MDIDPRLLLLAPEDDVLVVRARIRAGESYRIGDGTCVAAQDLPLGHKVARRAIAPGAKVMKHGAPIGVATTAIAAGAHVHVHNIRSDYTPTYTLDAARPTSDVTE
jgi:predicted RecA/RadA family phage recombinase